MGDSNSSTARAVLRTGNSKATATVKAAFTREGTLKKGASKAVIERAKAALKTVRNRKLAGRGRRKANATARAARAVVQTRAAALGRNANRQALNRARLRGD